MTACASPATLPPLAVGARLEGAWMTLESAELAQFWTATRLDGAYGPYDDSYVPGFYLVAVLDPLAKGLFQSRAEFEEALNYGFDRLRFTTMVLPGQEVRLVCTVAEIEERPSGTLVALDAELQIRAGKPALVARWLFLLTQQNQREDQK